MMLQARSLRGVAAQRQTQQCAVSLKAPLRAHRSSRATSIVQAAVDPFAAPSSAAATAKPTSGTDEPGKRKKFELPYAVSKTWVWRNKKINYMTAGCGAPVVLVHGFGLSAGHYRRMIKELSKSYKVYALDLLGFGDSSKPALQYSIELWGEQLRDFCGEFTSGTGVTLVGNSIGSLVALQAAVQMPPGAVRGIVLLNAAGAMNNKGVVADWRIVLVYPILLLIDFLLSIPSVAKSIFDGVAKPDNIRQALSNVYTNTASVDDELVDLVHGPSLDDGARDVFVSVITGPPGPKPFGLVRALPASLPLLVLWGDKDTLTPADGPVGKFFQALPTTRPASTFTFLPDVGHCLHDDKPELVHAELVPWLAAIHGPSYSPGAGPESAGADVSCAAEQAAAAARAAGSSSSA